MKNIKYILPTLLASLCLSSLSHAQTQTRPGLWEYTNQMQMPGIPSQPMTQRVCLSAKDLEKSPVPAQQDDSCQIKNYQLTGKTATWKIECQGETRMTGEGSISFQSDKAYQGTTHMRIEQKGEAPMVMQQKFSARWVGECRK